jgi:hypothetical protein
VYTVITPACAVTGLCWLVGRRHLRCSNRDGLHNPRLKLDMLLQLERGGKGLEVAVHLPNARSLLICSEVLNACSNWLVARIR